MGSMRNPVGPLPSSIYWRRRAILGAVLVLVALLVVWLVNATGGGGGGKKDGAQGSGGSSGPAPSITPGPSGSGPAISQQPGGRDESGGSDKDDDGTATPGDGASDGATGGGSGKDGSAGDGSGDGSDGTGGANDAGGEGGSGASGKGAATGSSDAQRVPAGSSLPDCTTDVAELSLRSAHNTYEPGKKPELELSVKNSSAAACKVDLGAARTVVTITLTGENAPYWSSKDCPATESLWLRVPAKETIRYEIEWNRKASRAACAKPPSGSAKPGTYLVEAKAPGLEKARTSFRLDKD
ncbi:MULTISPECIES: hypothetical protein [unclassified Streptomyces]|uniref:hypothetical protein n=1 Tax=unclassified Streptomyces TaxID=2593676 RepID=UPI001F420A64|nr:MULTISPECIES: hypothetical protein [unclassified Streptomyces]